MNARMAAVVMMILAAKISGQEPQTPPEVEPPAQIQAPDPQELRELREIQLSAQAVHAARRRVEAVLGEDVMPSFEIRILRPAPKAGNADKEDGEEAEQEDLSTVFSWNLKEVLDEDKGDGALKQIPVITVGQARLRDTNQFAYDLAHICMVLQSSRLPSEKLLREPLALICASGGEPLEQMGKLLKERGGPLSLKELTDYFSAKNDPPKTEVEHAQYIQRLMEVQASAYLIGFDLQQRGLIKKFFDGKITAEELKSEIDPEKAWERQKETLLPKPRLRRIGPLDPATIG